MDPESFQTLMKVNKNIVLVIPNDEYNELIWDTVSALSAEKKPVCYVSVNKSSNATVAGMVERKIDPNNFYFVDTISKTVMSDTPLVRGIKADRMIFMSNPAALEELSDILSKLLSERKVSTIFIDSLSTLLIYNDDVEVIKFAHNITGHIGKYNGKGIFTLLKKDVSSQKIKDIGLFVDKVVELGTTQFEETTRVPSMITEVRLSRKIALPFFAGTYVVFAFILSYTLFFTSGMALTAEVSSDNGMVMVEIENESAHIIRDIQIQYVGENGQVESVLGNIQQLDPEEFERFSIAVPPGVERMTFEATAPFHQVTKESVRIRR